MIQHLHHQTQSVSELKLTNQPGEFAEAPGDVDRQHGAVALLEGQVGQVVREAAQLLRDAGVAEVQHYVEAQRLEGGEVALPGEVVKLDAGWILLVLRQAEHLQMVVTHKVLGLALQAAKGEVLERNKTGLGERLLAWWAVHLQQGG